MPKTIEDTLARTKETLKQAHHGLQDLMSGDPNKHLVGYRNLIVWGRAVTNVLQGLKSITPEFEPWYQNYVDEMKNDPLLRFIYTCRSVILKQGVLESGMRANCVSFRYPQDLERFGPPPANQIGCFIGDKNGGSGWIVKMEDGSEEHFYVDLPIEFGSITTFLPSAPDEHLGEKLIDNSISNVSQLYYTYMKKMVDDAIEKFKNSGNRKTLHDHQPE